VVYAEHLSPHFFPAWTYITPHILHHDHAQAHDNEYINKCMYSVSGYPPGPYLLTAISRYRLTLNMFPSLARLSRSTLCELCPWLPTGSVFVVVILTTLPVWLQHGSYPTEAQRFPCRAGTASSPPPLPPPSSRSQRLSCGRSILSAALSKLAHSSVWMHRRCQPLQR